MDGQLHLANIILMNYFSQHIINGGVAKARKWYLDNGTIRGRLLSECWVPLFELNYTTTYNMLREIAHENYVYRVKLFIYSDLRFFSYIVHVLHYLQN